MQEKQLLKDGMQFLAIRSEKGGYGGKFRGRGLNPAEE
jgi:hypothetical protein